MGTAEWALVLSAFAFGISLWQWKSNKKEKMSRRRTELLQEIKNVEILCFSLIQEATLEMIFYKKKKEANQDFIDKFDKSMEHFDEIYKSAIEIRDHWSDYNDGKSLLELEEQRSIVNDVLTTLNSMNEMAKRFDVIMKR